jgi:hypothetical protein
MYLVTNGFSHHLNKYKTSFLLKFSFQVQQSSNAEGGSSDEEEEEEEEGGNGNQVIHCF